MPNLPTGTKVVDTIASASKLFATVPPTIAVPLVVPAAAKNAVLLIPDLTGFTRAEAVNKITASGFVYKSTTKGGYMQYKHSDGSIIWIRPNGEVTRSGPKVISQQGKPYNPRYNQNGQKIQTQDHNTGEFLLVD